MNGYRNCPSGLQHTIPWSIRHALTLPALILLAAVPAWSQQPEPKTASLTPKPGKSSLQPINEPPAACEETQAACSETTCQPWQQDEMEQIQQIRSQLRSSGFGSLSQILGNASQSERLFSEELAKLYLNQGVHPAPTQNLQPAQSPAHPTQRLRPLPPGLENHGRVGGLEPLPAHDSNLSGGRLNARQEKLGCRESAAQLTTIAHTNRVPGTGRMPAAADPSTSPRPSMRVSNPYSAQPNSFQRAKILSVRDVAVRLEQAAAELEDLQLYEDADLLRSTADGIWKRARQIESQLQRSANSQPDNPNWAGPLR